MAEKWHTIGGGHRKNGMTSIILYLTLCGAQNVPVEIVVTEAGKPVPCRIHLKDRGGRPVLVKSLPWWRDHFVCPGKVELELREGRYFYEVERGPEYSRASGDFTIEDVKSKTVRIEIRRLFDLSKDGWWCGDLHIHRKMEDVELLMDAEDLDVGPVITWWNNRNLWKGRELPENPLRKLKSGRVVHLMSGEDEREGGALMYYNLRKPLEITGSSREYPSPMRFLNEARTREGVHVDVEKPFWWDVPIWAASGQIDTIGIANNHMCRSTVYPSEAWGRPRDTKRLPPPLGNGRWTQEIYYHLLNAGLRIPPSAGSASGVLPNPVGYNRVYVFLDGEFSWRRWWRALRAGRSFVTNGPLLRVLASGQLPGAVFRGEEGQTLELDVRAKLFSHDPVTAVEIIKNGEVARSLSADEAKKGLGRITFTRSGWFLVRALTDKSNTFRFASTAPFYVEIGPEKRRISRASAKFFLDWVEERMERVPRKEKDPGKQRAVLKHHEAARAFWRERMEKANADLGAQQKTLMKKTYVYKEVDGLKIHLDVYRAAGEKRRPVVVWIHGGALINGSRNGVPGDIRKLCQEKGYALVSLDYRLAPEVKVPAIIEDIKDAFKWIREKGPEAAGLDPRKLVVAGGSAGGYLTMMTGVVVKPRPTALVAYWGYGDIDGDWYTKPSPHYRSVMPILKKEDVEKGVNRGVLTGVTRDYEFRRERGLFYRYLRQNGFWTKAVSGFDPDTEVKKIDPYCPVRNITPKYPPIFMIHGTNDTDVPYSKSADMAFELARRGVEHELMTIPKGGHGLGGSDPRHRAYGRARALAWIRRFME